MKIELNDGEVQDLIVALREGRHGYGSLSGVIGQLLTYNYVKEFKEAVEKWLSEEDLQTIRSALVIGSESSQVAPFRQENFKILLKKFPVLKSD